MSNVKLIQIFEQIINLDTVRRTPEYLTGMNTHQSAVTCLYFAICD